MRFAIVDKNPITQKMLTEWLEAQVFLSPEDRLANRVLACAMLGEVLPLVPNLDAVWLEATPNLRQDIDEIRARSRTVGRSARPIVVLIIDQPDPEITAFAVTAQLATLETKDVRSFLSSYAVVERLLKDDPRQPEQVFVHT